MPLTRKQRNRRKRRWKGLQTPASISRERQRQMQLREAAERRAELASRRPRKDDWYHGRSYGSGI